MYGVRPDLDLKPFMNAMLTGLFIGEFQIQFSFTGADPLRSRSCNLSVESAWEYRNGSGEIVDSMREHATRDSYRIHRLLGHSVTATRLDPPRSITLTFDDGSSLTVFDDSEQYESFQIQPGDVVV